MAKLVRESLNEKFTKKSDPIHDMGIGNVYNIDFFYADHPSIEDSYFAEYISNLESVIEDIDPDADFEIRITDFAEGYINFKGSNLSGKEMLEKLKEIREANFGSWDSNIASWDFGEVSKGLRKDGKIYDPEDYETEYCDNCGEEINANNELDGNGYCEACAPEDEEYEEDED